MINSTASVSLSVLYNHEGSLIYEIQKENLLASQKEQEEPVLPLMQVNENVDITTLTTDQLIAYADFKLAKMREAK